jgi:8-oxo-dGTP diphosphatase
MQPVAPTQPPTLVDLCWQMTYRLGFPVAQALRHVLRPRHEGALVAIYVGQALLLVRSSYRAEWNFPGGTVRRGETPEVAAKRELSEEVGLSASPLQAAAAPAAYGRGEQTTCTSSNCGSSGSPSSG